MKSLPKICFISSSTLFLILTIVSCGQERPINSEAVKFDSTTIDANLKGGKSDLHSSESNIENTNNQSNNSQGNSIVTVSESVNISNQIKQDIVSFRKAASDLSSKYINLKIEYERYGDYQKLYYLAIQYKGRAISMLTEIENYKNSNDNQLNNDQRFDLEMLLAGTGVLELTKQECQFAIDAGY